MESLQALVDAIWARSVRWLVIASVALVGCVVVGANASAVSPGVSGSGASDSGAAGSGAVSSNGYVVVDPTRIVDTRVGGRIDDRGPDIKGRPTDGSVLRVPVVGRAGVSGDVAGVALNVTVAGATGLGHVSVFACDAAVPSTSSVNFRPGVAVANLVMSKLGENGDVCVLVRGSADVVIDVLGFVPAGGSPRLVDPTRVADTRVGERIDDDGPDVKGRRGDGSVLRVPVAGRAGIDGDVAGVVLNVTAVGAAGLGHASVFACDTAVPSTSSVNFRPGAAVANLVMSKLGSKGDVCVSVRGSADVVIDVLGLVPAGGTPRLVDPTRVVDTRVGGQIDDDGPDLKGRRENGSVLRMPIVGRAGVDAGVADASGQRGVVLNVTAAAATGLGHVSVFACDTAVPSTSNLNFEPGAAVANLVVSKLGAGGDVCLFVRGSTELIVDVVAVIDSAPQVNPPTTSTTGPATTTTGAPTGPTTSSTSTSGPTTSTSGPTTSTSGPTTSSSTTTSTSAPPVVDRGPFQATFTLPPMGTARYDLELYETMLQAASRLEPVGLYLDLGDVVFIEVSSGINIEAQVGMGGDLDGKIQRAELGNGLNQLVATHEGPLLLANESADRTATATVYASEHIKRIPTFHLGQATDAEVNAGVERATDVPKFFLVGDYFMAYVTRSTYLATNSITGSYPVVASPMSWLRKRDREIRMYHEYVGRNSSVNRSNANSYPQSRELISTGYEGYMSAGGGRVHLNGAEAVVMERLFDMDDVRYSDGHSLSWGPWHELGHHQQLFLGSFNASQEATPNIYAGMLSLKSGHDYGFGLWEEHRPSTIYADPAGPADATQLDHPKMWPMFMQLYAAFGEAFYTRLHHLYRLVDHQTRARTTDRDKYPLFVYMASRASGYDLTPFFQAWRFPMTDEYTNKIAALNLPRPRGDLAERVITDIKSPADLTGRYEKQLSPYTNLPVGDAKSDFMLPFGAKPSPEDLVDYDRTVVKSAEFLNPNEDPFAQNVANSRRKYGATMVEVLLTGFDGQQNVVVVTGTFAPEQWGPNVSHSSVYDRVAKYVRSTNFQSGNIDLAEAEMHLEMIHGTDHADTALLVGELQRAIATIRSSRHGSPLHDAYFDSLTDADTVMYRDRPAIRFDATQWAALLKSGDFHVQAFESDATYPYRRANDRFLGQVTNNGVYPRADSLDLVKVEPVGSDVFVYVDAPYGTVIPVPYENPRPIDEITFKLWHQDYYGEWQTPLMTIAPDYVGSNDEITGHWVDAQFRADMTYLENGNHDDDVMFSLAEHAWRRILANGSIELNFYRNGDLVGRFDGTTWSGVTVTIADGAVTIRVRNPGLDYRDVYTLTGSFTSAVSPERNGPILLRMTGNMLAADLPIYRS